ncbi:DUF3558 domain-containing protein [Nocardia sp. NPDC051787]|uniref:DUF3558 domain-containing protein n=1 Tax=Nocardia sp. NPDC051787 TaxID=3155415 RepID=UPI003448EF7C
MGGRTGAAVMLAGVLTLAGCTQPTDEAATPSASIDKKAATAALWDPCTQISDQTLRSLDVDPATRESGVGGVQTEGWKMCSWSPSPRKDYSLTVDSSIFTVDDFKKKEGNVDFVDISVKGRSGWRYHRSNDKKNEKCDLLFPSSQGVHGISFYNLSPSAKTVPCDRALAAADVLVPLFPK